VERESTAIPVPEKVFEDMRSCGAGVLHVGAEGKYLDRDGNEHTKINDNVLIDDLTKHCTKRLTRVRGRFLKELLDGYQCSAG
jgi:hypothetical protein